MKPRYIRRFVYLIFTFALSYAAYFFNLQLLNKIQTPLLFTGWLLLILIVLLISFNFRKKLSFIPLGSAYLWSQVHIYLGLVTSFVFFLHLDFELPNGRFETFFATLLTITLLSGLIGLMISRILPKIMRQHSENVIFERIPALRARLVQDAEAEFQKAIENNSDKTLLDYFTQRALPFLHTANPSFNNFMNPRKNYQAWNMELSNLQKLLNQQEAEILLALQHVIYKKIGLDFQLKGRSFLRHWLYWHIPLSYSLICFAIAHIILVYGFSFNIL